jgi:predicted Zn-dependent peptidase
MILSRSLMATSLLALAACASTPAMPPPPAAPPGVPRPAPASTAPSRAETPDAPFRTAPPPADGSVTFTPPKIVSFNLKNGVKVLMVERHELPIVAVRVVVKGGQGDLATERPGVMSFVGAMLEQGTATRTALQISDDYEAIGAQHGASMQWDSGGASVKVLGEQLDKGLAILADVVQKPSFPEAEIARLKARRVAALSLEKNSPPAMAANALAASVYGRAHPYGHSLSGREDDIKKVGRDELLRAYRRVYVPRNAAIVVAGDVTRKDLEPKLEAAFGGWKGGAAPALATPKVAAAKDAPRLVLVDRPGAPQAQVLLAEPGVAMSTPDRDALTVMNAILGGVFSSRINMNLREAHAYTYGARSRFVMRHGAGPFNAGGAIFSDKTGPAIHELFTEITRMAQEDVRDEELADAKEFIKLGMPGRFETVTDVTGALEDLFVYDLPLDEYATRAQRIAAVTAADVKKVAAAHIHPRTLKIIVVGDRAKLEPGLESLHLGTPELRDAFGDVIPATVAPVPVPVPAPLPAPAPGPTKKP